MHWLLISTLVVITSFNTLSSYASPIVLPVAISVSVGEELTLLQGTPTSTPTTTTTTSTSSPVGPFSGVPGVFTAGPFATGGPFGSYYSGYEATQTSVQPQPMVSDYVRGKVFPLNLTNPDTIPLNNFVDPVVLPPSRDHPNPNAEISKPGTNFSTSASLASLATAYDQISAIIQSNVTKPNQCQACISGLQIAKELSFEYPWEVPSLLLKLCNTFTSFTAARCLSSYSINTSGGVIATVLQVANLTGLDGIMMCSRSPIRYCDVPPVTKYDASLYFNTTLPAERIAPPSSGKTTKVLHLSDLHLDPRYTIGSEAQCDNYLCCRLGPNTTTAAIPSGYLLPAPRFGAYKCDSPYDLVISAMEAIPPLTGTIDTGFDFTIFTGDLISHDPDSALGRDYTEYEELMVFSLFKKFLGNGPTYAALGNHDSWPQALVPLNSLNPTYLSEALSWNFAHLASLWEHEGWISSDDAQEVRTHYGGYSKLHKEGLRIITFNSDFLYNPNLYNYIDMENPDPSGTFRWIAGELQRAEDNGERVWMISHVLSGWDGSASLKNPSDLWAQIVDRYSPHVIAANFAGHIHDEVIYINYRDNGTVISSETASGITYVGPSLAPLTNLNSGFRMYEVDTGSFDVINSYTWYSNISDAQALDSQTEHGAVYQFEYSARDSYGKNITGLDGNAWPETAPLNSTWWHLVTEQMEIEPSLVNTFNSHQGRLSVKSSNCTSEACVKAKICYMRSSTNALGQACPKGYSSVQSPLP